jgi:hypothetical protein
LFSVSMPRKRFFGVEMLKTLRVTSFFTVILAAFGVITIAVLGLKGDSLVKDFLAKPGIVDELREKAGQEGVQEEKSSPLVAMAKLIALRLDPPPPPKPVVKDVPRPPAETVRAKPSIPQPKVQTSAKFDLLATVVYETAPEKSLALLKMSANKQEWFRQGEKAGYLELQEIRDGSVVFSQRGREPEEVFVPAKPQVKSLLKSEQKTSTAPRTGSGSITAQLPALGQGQASQPDAAPEAKAVTAETTDSGNVRLVRPARPDVASRIQRARSTPQPAPPQEQKKSITKTMSGIEEIMKRQDEAVSGQGRKKENEMWMRLLKELNTEKERLETPAEELPGENAQNKTEQPEPSTKGKPQDADSPAPVEPNES